jgi:hypothetical protein
MGEINPQLLSSVHFEKGIIQKVNTLQLGQWEDVDPEEIGRLDLSLCPNCQTSIRSPSLQPRNYYGSKYHEFRIYHCEWCCWLSIYKYPVYESKMSWAINKSPEPKHYKSFHEFNHYEEHPEIQFLIRFLARENEKLGEISWKAFQELAKAYLIDQGMDVADISRIKSSGGDFLCVDVDGNVFVVEVKHLNRKKKPVDIGTVWKVIGVITTEGLDGGMLITSHRFSPDAITLIERGSIGRITKKEERRGMKYVELETLIRWLQDVQVRERKDILGRADWVIYVDNTLTDDS